MLFSSAALLPLGGEQERGGSLGALCLSCSLHNGRMLLTSSTIGSCAPVPSSNKWGGL